LGYDNRPKCITLIGAAMSFHIQWVAESSGAERLFTIATPVCPLIISMQGDVIVDINWNCTGLIAQETEASKTIFGDFVDDYWLSTEKTVPIKLLKQGTDFSQKVWAEMLKIPLGKTLSYSALANKIGSSARAVGNACRANPYPLVIPCHRVVSVNGLGGYHGHTQGQFMDIKTKLLGIEAAKSA
jgi:methylated-DNA-[protein]-cysteine S-methyltransferase